jgi:ppGpp synthetase/RelA/SpoT-type nucleotidyltranferase
MYDDSCRVNDGEGLKRGYAKRMASSDTKAQLTIEQVETRLATLRPGQVNPGHWALVARNAETWAKEVSVGPFWSEAEKRLSHWRTEYRQVHGGDLLGHIGGLPPFQSKSESSIKDKVIRRCKGDVEKAAILFPESCPPVPQVSDLVRTRVQCRYIDGVEFLASKFVDLAKEFGYECERDRQGKLEGYFAQHVTVKHDVFYRVLGHPQACTVSIEIQVASELATRMWDATHGLYEVDRSDGDAPRPQEWQWQPSDPRFISNQLGHMMHLADGLLVHLRNVSNVGQKK